MRILIVHCMTKTALAVVKGLNRDCEIYGASAGNPRLLGLTFVSPRIEGVHHFTPPEVSPEQFVADVVRIARELSVDAILPLGDSVSNCTSKHKAEIAAATGAVVLIEDYDKLESVTDKWSIAELCREVDVPVPETAQIRDIGELRREIKEGRITYPFVLKPTVATAAEGVRFFRSPADTEAFELQDAGLLDAYDSFVMQQAIDGELHDVTSCSCNGRVLSMLTQQRLLGWRDFGGGGIINRTTFEPTTMRYATRLIEHTRWSGPALWDFVKDVEGNYYLLECNTRFWGTT